MTFESGMKAEFDKRLARSRKVINQTYNSSKNLKESIIECITDLIYLCNEEDIDYKVTVSKAVTHFQVQSTIKRLRKTK